MSWFGGSEPTVELDAKIAEATSEAIPNGELELPIALEITDLIRSKKVPAKKCMRSLKKRLQTVQQNPNLVKLSLLLIDLCVKNGGFHFLVEIASKEFLDYFVDVLFKIHYNVREVGIQRDVNKYEVGCVLFNLLRSWTEYFRGQLQLNNVEKYYNQLIREGFDPNLISHNDVPLLGIEFVNTEVAPDWVDGDECMICYNPFTVLNRKHHCRSCGGVYCQTHSSNSIPLLALGIKDPVRVCDNCYEKNTHREAPHEAAGAHSTRSVPSHIRSASANARNTDDDDEDFRRAIEMSLKESQVAPSYAQAPQAPQGYAPPSHAPPQFEQPQQTQGNTADDEMDDEMKAAIAASLKEYNDKEKLYQQQLAPEDNFYGDLLPQQAPQPQNAQFRAPAPIPTHQSGFQAPAAAPQQQPEDLTQQEEESINLFVTLMNNLKNDPQKQANILYDNNLSELHNNIIKFKPKLNRSLRASLEKYESLLEMSNKISTITRLYDQFLENKLAQAYGGHSLYPPPPQEQYDHSNQFVQQQLTGYAQPQQQQYQYAQGTGYLNQPQDIQHNGYPAQHQQPQRNSQQLGAQVTSPPQQQTTGYIENQHAIQKQPQPASYPDTNQTFEPQSTGHHEGNQVGYPIQQQIPQPETKAKQSYQSFPEPDNNNKVGYPENDYQIENGPSEPEHSLPPPPPPTTFNQAPNSTFKALEPQEFDEAQHLTTTSTGPYPNLDYHQQHGSSSSQFYPSEPPALDADAEEEEAEEVTAPQSEPEDEKEEKVAAKFPSMSEIENQYNVSAMPSVSDLPPIQRTNTSQSRYAEEPLIEL